MLILYIVLALLISAFVTGTGFLVLVADRKLRAEKRWAPGWIKFLIVLWKPAMAVADVVLNMLYGSWIFREAPKELLFSQRVQRHYDNSKRAVEKTWRHKLAFQWFDFLNLDPGHID